MRRIFTPVIALCASLAASSAHAQAGPPGWQVCWGPPGNQICSPSAVPLEPWMVAALAILLGITLIWVQRRHSGFGAYLMAAALGLAVVGYSVKDVSAIPPPIYDFDLTTPSGVLVKICPQVGPESVQPLVTTNNYLTVHNGTTATVQLVITPRNGADINWGVPGTKCGTSLDSNATCNLPCMIPG